MAPREAAVEVPGGRLRYGAWNADRSVSVLAVHGITANHRAWFAVADALPDLGVVAPDLRGRGRSAGLPGPAGLEHHAADLVRLLDALGLDRVVTLGHSMGGMVALVLADLHPDRVERLVLVDGGPPLPLPAGTTPEQGIDATLGPAAARLSMTFENPQTYQHFFQGHPAFGFPLDNGVEAYLDYDLVPTPDGYRSSVSLDRIREDAASMYGEPLAGAAARLRRPARFLRAPRGLLDQPEPLYPRAALDAWAATVPDVLVDDVPDVNHYSVIWAPHAVAQVAAAVRGREADRVKLGLTPPRGEP